MPALRRVGHKGADLIAPGNTVASFEAALDAGVDMIEFDVLPERGGGDRLLLAHDYTAVADAPSLEEGLEVFASEAYGGVELDVDLKLPGYEERVLGALRSFGLLERALISTQYVESLRILRSLGGSEVRLGWSVPRVRRDYTSHPVTVLPALAVLTAYRAALPARAERALREGRCDALMAHWRLVTPRLVRVVASAGGQLFVWTVDDLASIRRLASLGVTGVITNDPRLFADLE
ncbi:MAG: glycerophosphoryl diester phosphodiesterase [Solirubrobacteraceae bacterium]|jgi:glycerophosphoryl diester phosphodiesterase|nr:glycerophosphoryl diester phosphodiesterase [Solirubrobacteraceae bacterium]